MKEQYGLKRAQACLSLTADEFAQHTALCAHHGIDFAALVQMSLLACVEDLRRGHRKALAESLRAFIRTPPGSAAVTQNVRIQPALRDAALLPMREEVEGVKVATFVRWALSSQHAKLRQMPGRHEAPPTQVIAPAQPPQQAPKTTARPAVGFFEGES